jgi:DNA replication and repair protein RecF
VQVNRQRLARTRDLLGALRVTVFAPDDLEMVKGGPATRRRYLDDLLVAHSPKLDVLRTDLDRIVRQRNALLKQMGGRHGGGEGALATLDVWDERLGTAGTGFVAATGAARPSSCRRCASRAPNLAGQAEIEARYEQSWSGARRRAACGA